MLSVTPPTLRRRFHFGALIALLLTLGACGGGGGGGGGEQRSPRLPVLRPYLRPA
jgi:hypothetical protein